MIEPLLPALTPRGRTTRPGDLTALARAVLAAAETEDRAGGLVFAVRYLLELYDRVDVEIWPGTRRRRAGDPLVDLVRKARELVLATPEPTRRWLLLANEVATLTDVCATGLSRPRAAGGPPNSFA